jgi:molybdenum cofactor cytidylyltransferase
MLSAVIVAAGLSRRMENKNKLLLPYRNKTIVEITVGQVLSAGIEDIVVVTGRDGDQVEALLQHLPLRLVHNPEFAAGLTGSIQKGITVARGNGYMICLADMVLVTPAEYGLLAEYFTRQRAFDPKCICLPVHEGQKGNPVVFSSWYQTAIAGHTDPEGCRDIVQAHADNVYRVEMPGPHILQDIDSPDDYHRLMAGSAG